MEVSESHILPTVTVITTFDHIQLYIQTEISTRLLIRNHRDSRILKKENVEKIFKLLKQKEMPDKFKKYPGELTNIKEHKKKKLKMG